MTVTMRIQDGFIALVSAIIILSTCVALTGCEQQVGRFISRDFGSTKKNIKLKQLDEAGQFDGSKTSYVIDGRRFFEPSKSRCYASIILKDPMSLEPSFVFIKAGDEEVRLNATAQVEDIKQESGFDPTKGTLVLVHGYRQSYPRTRWLRNIRDLFRENHTYDRYNLIFMDWSKAARGSYNKVSAVTNVMGSFLSNMLMKLVHLGADPSSIHLVGHSIGCHLAGLAGKKTWPKIGRITGLDPAGPCFGKPHERLAVGDAQEVAIYHYDDAFLGLPGQHGHHDIYVNGGRKQPGVVGHRMAMWLAFVNNLMQARKPISEGHMRPVYVHTNQLARANCQQVAYECRDYQSFLAGECGHCDEQNNQCFLMALPFQYDRPTVEASWRASPVPGKRMYLETSSNGTFCLQHYQILVRFEAQQAHKVGPLHLELVDQLGQNFNVILRNFMEPNVLSYLLLVDTTTPGRFNSARLQVGHEVDCSFRLKNIEINFMSHERPDVRRSLSSVLCPSRAGETVNFELCSRHVGVTIN